MKKITKDRVLRKSIKIYKSIKFCLNSSKKSCVPIFILGSGRSGTTLLLNIFHLDKRVQSCGENNPKIADNYILNYQKLDNELAKKKAKHFVCKPILNSFNAQFILNKYQDCRMLWIFRDYKDVIASSFKKFGTKTVTLIKDTIFNDSSNNWISRGIRQEDREKMIELASKNNLSSYDYDALIWWSVNKTPLHYKINTDRRLKLISYENIVHSEKNELIKIYNFIGLEYRQAKLRIHAKSIGKGKSIVLNPVVEKMCDNLLLKLNEVVSKNHTMI